MTNFLNKFDKTDLDVDLEKAVNEPTNKQPGTPSEAARKKLPARKPTVRKTSTANVTPEDPAKNLEQSEKGDVETPSKTEISKQQGDIGDEQKKIQKDHQEMVKENIGGLPDHHGRGRKRGSKDAGPKVSKKQKNLPNLAQPVVIEQVAAGTLLSGTGPQYVNGYKLLSFPKFTQNPPPFTAWDENIVNHLKMVGIPIQDASSTTFSPNKITRLGASQKALWRSYGDTNWHRERIAQIDASVAYLVDKLAHGTYRDEVLSMVRLERHMELLKKVTRLPAPFGVPYKKDSVFCGDTSCACAVEWAKEKATVQPHLGFGAAWEPERVPAIGVYALDDLRFQRTIHPAIAVPAADGEKFRLYFYVSRFTRKGIDTNMSGMAELKNVIPYEDYTELGRDMLSKQVLFRLLESHQGLPLEVSTFSDFVEKVTFPVDGPPWGLDSIVASWSGKNLPTFETRAERVRGVIKDDEGRLWDIVEPATQLFVRKHGEEDHAEDAHGAGDVCQAVDKEGEDVDMATPTSRKDDSEYGFAGTPLDESF